MASKILIVDDNATTRRLVRDALVRHGHDVLEAADGRSARELMKREQPRVVLQDLVLPDADGFVLVGELRSLAPGASILAFSGFVSKLDQVRVSNAGFDDIITKPIAPSRLVPLVEAHLPVETPSPAQFGSGRRLVIADDDPLQLKLAQFRLARLGFEVEAVGDGAAALAAVRARRPDAVVSDVMMPNLDGFQLAMALRQDPGLTDLPLVLVTSSYVEPNDRDLARRAGANDLVLRTPELGDLITALRDSLVSEAPPSLSGEDLRQLEDERTRRALRQLERQVMLNSGLARRCSALASELTVLAGISEAVLKQRDLDTALDEALATCFDAGGVAVGALYLLEGSGLVRARSLGGDAAWTRDVATFFGREELVREVIASDEALLVPSPSVPEAIGAELLARCEANALLLLPIASARIPLGALLVVSRRREVDVDDWRQFALGVATQIGQVLALARAYADRQAAEQRAGEQAALLSALIDSAPDTVIHLDIDGKILFVNRPLRGLPPAEVVGTSFFERLPREQAKMIRETFERVVHTGETAEYETPGVRDDGRPGSFSVRLGAVKRDGQVVGIVMIARDITERKQTEMQLMLADRMASVGTLAAGVAHEINNPLAAVIANLDMARHDIAELAGRTTLPGELEEELADARTAADRVREIVRDLKIFSRSQEDKRGAVDIEKVLDSTMRMAWNEARHRAKVVKHYAKVPRVDANESRLGQVFLNLIVNAIHAIPEGNFEGNEIRIRTALEDGRVVVSIADTGAGIPLDVQPRLFTPFFTTKPVGVGTGLGLAISHRIITQLGGTIAFTSAPGKGTEFRVALPVARGDLPVITQSLPTGAPAKRRARVLVVDDEESLAQAMRRYLLQDHDVDAVTSGRAALDLFEAGQHYDAVLCDLMMPQITGAELYAEVKRRDPALADRMVFVTGGTFTETARSFLESVPNRRIEKPFDLSALRHIVNEVVGE